MTFSEELSAFLEVHPYRIFNSGKIRIKYIVSGPEDKQPVVFLNGLNMQETWINYVKALEQGYRVLMLEYPLAPKTCDALLDVIACLLDSLGIRKPVVIGASDGGLLAQLFLRRFPDNISALILMTTLTVDSKYCEDTRKELPYLPLIKGMFRVMPYGLMKKRLIGQVEGYFSGETPEEQEYGKNFLQTIASDKYYRKKFIHSVGIVGDMSRQKIFTREEFEPVRGKILLLQPENDIFTKEDQQKLVDVLPDARLKTMRGGHLSFVMCSSEYLSEIRGFLSEL